MGTGGSDAPSETATQSKHQHIPRPPGSQPAADVHIGLVGRQGLAEQIYRQLRAMINRGSLRPGDRLPSSRELGRRLHVSRNTVVSAYDRLAAEGLVRARTGVGVEVAAAAYRPTSGLRSVPTALKPQPLWARIGPAPDMSAVSAEFDFRAGIPTTERFPFETWRALLSDELRAARVGPGAYGDPAGRPELRDAVARHLAVARSVIADPADVVITSGTQQSVDLITRVMLAPGDVVAVEDPGYRPVTQLLRSHRLDVVGVPVDRQGLMVDRLPANARLIYVTPSHQFPLGMAMSPERRLELLAWAAHTDAAIIEDDYDSEFRFTGRPLDPLHSVDDAGRVIYVGSFSKTTLPTMRLGYLIAPPDLLETFRRAKWLTDWFTFDALQGAMADFISRGSFARHIRRTRRLYAARHAVIEHRLGDDLDEFLESVPAKVGIHLSAHPRFAATDVEVVDAARKVGVELKAISPMGTGQRDQDGLLIGYGAIPEDRINAGLDRLREVLRQLSDARPRRPHRVG